MVVYSKIPGKVADQNILYSSNFADDASEFKTEQTDKKMVVKLRSVWSEDGAFQNTNSTINTTKHL